MDVRVTGVTADMGNVSNMLSPEEHSYIDAHPVDVEDLANMTITFSDGSKAVIMAGDMVVGGVKTWWKSIPIKCIPLQYGRYRRTVYISQQQGKTWKMCM